MKKSEFSEPQIIKILSQVDLPILVDLPASQTNEKYYFFFSPPNSNLASRAYETIGRNNIYIYKS